MKVPDTQDIKKKRSRKEERKKGRPSIVVSVCRYIREAVINNSAAASATKREKEEEREKEEGTVQRRDLSCAARDRTGSSSSSQD